MGTEYFIKCNDRKDRFELGKGHWRQLREALFIPSPRLDPFIEEFLAKWVMYYGDDDEGIEEYVRAVARTVWKWCDEREWKVELVHDAVMDEPEWLDWPVTGTRYDPEPEEEAKLSDSQSHELRALVGEQQSIIRVVSDLRLYRMVCRKLLDTTNQDFSYVSLAEFKTMVEAIEAGEDPRIPSVGW